MENSDIGFIIYMSILSLLGIFLNLPIIIVYRKKYTHSASLYLLFALALLNFLISLIVVPITLITTIEVFYISNRFYCGMSYFLRFFSNSIAVILLGLIAYERYNIISAKTITKLRIMEQNLMFNSKRATLVAVVVCFIFSLWCFYFFENQENKCTSIESVVYYNGICCVVLGGVMVLMIVIYIKAYLIVHRSTTKVLIKNINLNQAEHKENIIKKFLFRLLNSSKVSTTDEKTSSSSESPSNTQTRSEKSSNQSDIGNFKIGSLVRNNKIRVNFIQIKETNDTNGDVLFLKKNISLKETFQIMNSKENQIVEVDETEYDDQPSSTKAIDENKYTKPIFYINESEIVAKQEQTPSPYVNQYGKRGSTVFTSATSIRKDWKVARMFFLVTLCFILTWIPWVFVSLDILDDDKILVNTYCLNNIINPVIYSFLSKSFRKDFSNLIVSFLRRNQLCVGLIKRI